MKAAILHEFKQPLSIEDVASPHPELNELLIQVEACGACHSDVHVADGDWIQLAGIVKKPLILGHEIAGRVVATGQAVEGFEIGDRVGLAWIHWSCGECEFCRDNNENLCRRQKITGVTVDGGYAERVKAPATHVLKIPDGLASLEAAPLFCAGVTVYRALKQAGVLAGQRLAVFGIGGLGHVAVQLGHAFGAEVVAVDISEEKLELARSLGASTTVHAARTDTMKQLRGIGGIHVCLVTSARKAAYETAFSCLRSRGTLLVVGLPGDNICFPPILMAAKEIRIQHLPSARDKTYEMFSPWLTVGRCVARSMRARSPKSTRCSTNCVTVKSPVALSSPLKLASHGGDFPSFTTGCCGPGSGLLGTPSPPGEHHR